MSTKGKMFFRFASEKTLREFALFAVPASSGEVRMLLKKKLAISAPLDVVLYEIRDNGKSSRYAMPDHAMINDGQKCLAKRVPVSLAKAILTAAVEAETLRHERGDSKSVRSVASSEEIACNASSSSVIDMQNGLELLSDSDDDDASVQLTSHKPPQQPSDAPSLNKEARPSSDQPSPFLPSTTTGPPTSYPVLSSSNHVGNHAGIPVVGTASITDNEPEFNPETDFDDEAEEDIESEQLMIQQIIQGQPGISRQSSLSSQGRNQRPTQPRENLASRYYRNCNLSWSKDSPVRPQGVHSGPSPSSNLGHVNFGHGNLGHLGGMRRPRVAEPLVPVRENYVCHICGEKGHHIKNCPKGHDPKTQKKIKPSTGLPRSWLQRIPDDQIAQHDGDVFCLPGRKNSHTHCSESRCSYSTIVEWSCGVDNRLITTVNTPVTSNSHNSHNSNTSDKQQLLLLCGGPVVNNKSSVWLTSLLTLRNNNNHNSINDGVVEVHHLHCSVVGLSYIHVVAVHLGFAFLYLSCYSSLNLNCGDYRTLKKHKNRSPNLLVVDFHHQKINHSFLLSSTIQISEHIHYDHNSN